MVNGSPVWAAVGGEMFVYRDIRWLHAYWRRGSRCRGHCWSHINVPSNEGAVIAPTKLSSTWVCNVYATLDLQYTSARRLVPNASWVDIPEMRITVVHGLDDDNPTMAAAHKQLAALALRKHRLFYLCIPLC